MIRVHGHAYAPGGPTEADGTPTCRSCGLPDATGTTTHPDAVRRYGPTGTGPDRSEAAQVSDPAQALGRVFTGSDRVEHPQATPGADGAQRATVQLVDADAQPGHRGRYPTGYRPRP